MILYGLIILVLVSLGLRNPVARPFDKDIVTVLKPLLALGIVLHHLHSQSVFLHEFERWGPVIVGFFFFISGYGLYYSYNNNPSYMKNFVIKNILQKLVTPIILAYFLNLLLNERCINTYSFSEHLTNPSGPSFFPNDWFLYALIFCYIVFMMVTKMKHIQLVFLACIILAFVIVTAVSGFARNWWATPLSFLVGAFYYHHESNIRNLVNGKEGLLLSTVFYFLVFGALMAGSYFYHSKVTTVLAYSLLPLLLVNCLIRVNVSSLAKNRCILFLSRISFEIYLVHGIIINFLRQRLDLSGFILVITTLPITLVGAFLFHELIHLCQKPIELKKHVI